MKEIIAIINQKGGVGKSTTVHSIAAGLTRKGFKVLMVDLDPQGNLSSVVNSKKAKAGLISLLREQVKVQDVVVKTKTCGDLIAAEPNLMLINIASVVNTDNWLLSESRLKEILRPLKKEYDYILIDTPPALNILTLNALTAADSLIITMHANAFSFQGLAQLYKTIESVRNLGLNGDLQIKGVLLTMYAQKTRLSKALTERLEANSKALGTVVFNSKIRESVKMAEAQTKKQDIFSYAPHSTVAIDYEYLINEILSFNNN